MKHRLIATYIDKKDMIRIQEEACTCANIFAISVQVYTVLGRGGKSSHWLAAREGDPPSSRLI